MRRHILLIIAFCLQIAARGQTPLDELDLSGLPQPTQAKALRYWFDDDAGSVHTFSIINGTHSIDVSSLLDGLHTIHCQIIDSEDKVTAPYSAIFLKMDASLSSSKASALRYWFDDDINVSTCNANVGTQVLDVSNLLDGLHTLHYQVVDTDGNASYIASDIFLKMDEMQGSGNVTVERLIYWFDDEETTTTVDMTSGMTTLDASMLLDGLHTIHYMVVCSNGSITSAYSSIFLRMNVDILATTVKGLRYWFDEETNVTFTEITQGTQIIEASHLRDGLHTVHYQIVDDSGAVTSPVSSIFLKMVEGSMAVTTAQSLRYWFDNDTDVKMTSITGGTQTIDVSNLLAGLHTLHYQLVDSDGQLTSICSGIFLKMFDNILEAGQNRITQYKYWLNNNTAAIQTVKLDAAVNPFTLIALLPMQKEPIRSTCFHFEQKDDKPMMYAKNDFRIRFCDAAGYWMDDSRQFTDYSVSREVEPVGELQATQTFPKVSANDVRWYTMQIAPGDTAAFKLSQPATVQVFAPSGEEVFKTSGSASVQWSGIHTWENGTYYLAVHDVTGSQSTMKLEYMHMDKYDVVDWDVHTVGNGGCSTITFKGNGFRDLYAVDLYNAQGDSVKSVAVGFIDDANVSVTFNFTDVPLGNYDAIFHFTTEDKTFHNILTVEEATDIELALDVQYPSSFLRGTSTRYTITVTNKGNSTAYDVPLEICLSASSFEEIESVFFKDINGNNIDALAFDFAEEDSISVEDKQYFMDIIQSISGLSTFVILKDTVRSIEVGFSDRLITIPPKQNYTVNVVVRCSSTINLHATIPSEWYSVYTTEGNPGQQTRRRAPNRDLCCEKEKWECIVSSVADVTGVIPKPLFDCIPSLIDLGTFTAFEIMCGNGNTTTENIKNYFANLFDNRNGNQLSAIGKWGFTALGCIGLRVLKMIDKLKKELEALRKSRTIAFNQAIEYDKIYAHLINQYDDKMKLADEFYNQGNINKAEELAEEAKGIKNEANLYKQWRDDKVNEVKVIEQKMNEIEARIDQENIDLANIISFFKNGIKLAQTIKNDIMCTKERLYAEQNCPPDPKKRGGSSTPAPPSDPNDIFGYLSEAGSKFIADSVARVNYTIEFENDTTFATAAAHTIVIKDTLDSRYFDLSKSMPTGIRIGEHEAFLDAADVVTKNNVTSFVKTIDMRPEINAIAQVDGTFSHATGIAQWTFQSLDPMTMEPTNDLMQGILPVNYNGTSGIGEVMFEVGMKQGKADGTQINNRAGIVFDYEEAILTPTWTNIVDAVAPSSIIDNSWMVNDSTLRITADGFDERSGVWKYTWYVQAGENAPWWKEGETESPQFDYHIFEGIDYGFCVLATDSAGNVEQKVIERERSFKTYGQDFEDGISPLPTSPEEEENVNGKWLNGKWYDLSGRRHDEPQENQVNIVGRKKILFRKGDKVKR